MSQFEIAIQNIQKLLDTINSGNYTSNKQIASAMNISTMLVNNLLKRVETEVQFVDGVYRASCCKAENTVFFTKYAFLIGVVLKNPTILLWQTKHISAIYQLTGKEVDTLLAFVNDVIPTNELVRQMSQSFLDDLNNYNNNERSPLYPPA